MDYSDQELRERWRDLVNAPDNQHMLRRLEAAGVSFDWLEGNFVASRNGQEVAREWMGPPNAMVHMVLNKAARAVFPTEYPFL